MWRELATQIKAKANDGKGGAAQAKKEEKIAKEIKRIKEDLAADGKHEFISQAELKNKWNRDRLRVQCVAHGVAVGDRAAAAEDAAHFSKTVCISKLNDKLHLPERAPKGGTGVADSACMNLSRNIGTNNHISIRWDPASKIFHFQHNDFSFSFSFLSLIKIFFLRREPWACL